MANLKDINYGIGKYLEASDASAIPGIGNNRKNIDLLNFKVATNNAYSLYNFKDGMIDAYQTEVGVDTSTSTNEVYDSSGKYYSGTSTTTVPGNDSYTKLLLHADGSNGGTAFTDSSSSGRSVTAGGSVHTDTTIKKIGTASAQFDGSGDYLQMADSGDFAFGAGNFTFDFWIYQETFGGYVYNQESGNTWLRMEQKGGGMEFNFYNNGSYANGWSSYMPWTQATMEDSWHHIALERDGANIRGWIDGTEVTLNPGDAPGSNNVPDISSVVWLGGKVSGSGYFQGYLDEFRMSKGIARYDGNFTPETLAGYGESYTTYNNMTLVSNAQTAQAAPTEGRLMLYEETSTGSTTLDTDLKGYVSRDGGTTYTQTPLTEDTIYENIAFNQGGIDSNTGLMLHCDGSNGGTTFTDSSDSPHTVSVHGATHTDTAVKKFGTASAQFDGTEDFLRVADSNDWDFVGPSTSAFTVDFWVQLTDHSGYVELLSQGSNPSTANPDENLWTIIHSHGSGLKFACYISNSVLLITGFGGEITDNDWHHVAVVRSGSTYTVYKDGTSVTSVTDADTATLDGALQINGRAQNDGSARFEFNGYMDEIRISTAARFTENFTPATRLSEAYNAGAYTEASTRRLVSGSVDISGQPSGTNMKYKIETLNQSVSKVCRLHGASLLWA